MDVKNIFIGLTNEGKEVLLYKNNECYIDLKTKLMIPFSEIAEESLFSYSDIIPKKSIFTSRVIANYERNRQQELVLQKCFIGNVYQVQNRTVSYFNTQLPMLYWGRKVGYEVTPFKPVALLYEKNDYEDLETGGIYLKKEQYDRGDYMVDLESLQPFQAVFSDTCNRIKMSKGKVLEKYRGKFDRSVMNQKLKQMGIDQ